MQNHETIQSFDVPGLVDFHTHVFEHHGYPDFNLNPDSVGITQNISTVVDQGGAGAFNLASFKNHIVKTSRTNVQCFVSSYLVGGNPRGEIADLFGPMGINPEKTIQAVQAVDPDLNFVRGIKSHCGPGLFEKWGTKPLEMAVEIAAELRLPVYVHLGSIQNLSPSTVSSKGIVYEVLEILRPGDILAHPYRPENGIVSYQGEIHPHLRLFKEKGILMDVGRGTTFSYKNLQILVENGYEPDIISSDLHGYNNGRVSFLQALDEMLYFGMPPEKIIQAVTSIPSKYLTRQPDFRVKICIEKKDNCYQDSVGQTIRIKKGFNIYPCFPNE